MPSSPSLAINLPFASISDKAFDPARPLLENLQCMRAAGFTHLHLSHLWTQPAPFTRTEETAWTEALTKSGIQVLDVHGCHPKGINLWSENEADKQRAMELFVQRMRLTQRMGGDAMVYHVPWKTAVTGKQIDDLLEALRQVEDLSRELGVRIALENHYRAENDQRTLSAAFETFDAGFVGFTFDPGHALISGNTDWLLQHCGPRLQILHLNDNDRVTDCHWCPLDPAGNADWPAIMRFIADSPYHKPLQLEVRWSPGHHDGYDAFLTEAFSAVQTAVGLSLSTGS